MGRFFYVYVGTRWEGSFTLKRMAYAFKEKLEYLEGCSNVTVRYGRMEDCL